MRSSGLLRMQLTCYRYWRRQHARLKYNNMASEVDRIINCVAIFYEEGKGGENFCKKNKFRCKVNPNEKRVVKLRETIR